MRKLAVLLFLTLAGCHLHEPPVVVIVQVNPDSAKPAKAPAEATEKLTLPICYLQKCEASPEECVRQIQPAALEKIKSSMPKLSLMPRRLMASGPHAYYVTGSAGKSAADSILAGWHMPGCLGTPADPSSADIARFELCQAEMSRWGEMASSTGMATLRADRLYAKVCLSITPM